MTDNTTETLPVATPNEYKGYSLFNDIEDAALRAFNRATVMTNIVEDNIDKLTRKITARGALLSLNYYMALPRNDMKDAVSLFEKLLAEKGIIHAGAK